MSSWTPAQRRAIESRDTNLLVSAGAGSGKTAVLVERVIRLVTDPERPLDIDRLLVVTFTNAAAAEMRQRIGAALARLHREFPERERLARQSLLLGKASIMTLHSFCLDLLRQHFYLLDLDPSFRVADEHEAQLLREEAVESVLEENYADPDGAFTSLIEGFTGKHDDREVRELILRLAAFAESNPDPGQWLTQAAEDFADESIQETLRKHTADLCRLVSAELRSAQDYLGEAIVLAEKQEGPSHYLERLHEDQHALGHAISLADEGWDVFRTAAQNIVFGRLPSRKSADEALRDRCKELREQAKDIVNKRLSGSLAQSIADFSHGMHIAAPLVSCLVRITSAFRHRYARVKREKGLVDFADLEHFCLQLLTGEPGRPSPVAEQLQRKYAEILTDEYQDINTVQEGIIRLLSRGDNLFMVGDVKQSIYRFRLAEPSLFLEKSLAFRQSDGGEAIDLAANFRSRPEVISAVNCLFSRIMTRQVGEMDYDEDAALRAGAVYPEYPTAAALPQLCLLDRRGGDSEEEDAPADAVTAEARFIAREVTQLLASGDHLVYDSKLGAYRPVRYRDIVVLLRATRGWTEGFVDEFGRAGIPVFADTASGYFAATEVSTMLSLLRVIDNPEQDIPLAAVLRSPLLGLSGDELSDIRSAAKDCSFFAALNERAATDDTLGQKLQSFLDKMLVWRRAARRGSLPELIWQLYRETGYYIFAGATPGGPQRQANLRALYDRACQYERTSFRGLFRFLRFIERLQESEGDLGSAKVLGEAEDVVRIMSVHKSKGLEFPVVFVAGLGRRFNISDQSRPVLIHRSLGLGPHAVELDGRNRYPTLPRLIIQDRLKREALAEEMRILYVALTRAREYLYLVGTLPNREKKLAGWSQGSGPALLSNSLLASARSPLDWLGAALVQSAAEHTFVVREVGGASAAHPTLAQEKHVAEPAGVEPPGDSGVARALHWRYPHLRVSTLAAKATVSELKSRVVDLEAEPVFNLLSKIAPVVPSGNGGAELGNAVHMLLQHAEFSKASDICYLRELKDRLVEQRTLPTDLADRLDLSILAAFFDGALGQRLAAASNVWREVPFSMMIPLQEVYPDQEGDEQVMLQGIIDCLFVHAGKLVLVDFKTDRSLRLLTAYRKQLAFYLRAVERLFGRPAEEAYLAFVTLSQDIQIHTIAGEKEEEGLSDD